MTTTAAAAGVLSAAADNLADLCVNEYRGLIESRANLHLGAGVIPSPELYAPVWEARARVDALLTAAQCVLALDALASLGARLLGLRVSTPDPRNAPPIHLPVLREANLPLWEGLVQETPKAEPWE